MEERHMGKDLNGKELGEGLSQRKDGRYCARYTDRWGKRHTLYDKSLPKLKNKFKHETALNELKKNTKGSLTLDEVFDDWINIFKVNTIKESTRELYKRTYRLYIHNELGSTPINKITITRIKKFYLANSNRAQTICNCIKAVLKGVFRYAKLEEYIKQSPVEYISIEGVRTNKKIIALTIEQEKTFLRYCDDLSLYSNIFKLMLNTGLRVSEACGITLDKIDLENGLLYIDRQMIYRDYKLQPGQERFYFSKTKSKKSERIIPLNESAIEIIKDQLKLRDMIKKNYFQKNCRKFSTKEEFKDLLFFKRAGNPLNGSFLNEQLIAIQNYIREKEDPDYPRFGCHTLRHTFGTRLYEMNVDPLIIQGYLGHKDVKTTLNTYVNLKDNNEIKKLDTLFSSMNSDMIPSEIRETFEKANTSNLFMEKTK